jgi:membrane protein
MIVVIRLRGLARLVVRRVAQLQLTQTAANLAFLSLLALVPVFTIAVSLLGATPMFARLRDALLRFLSANLFLPSFSETLVRYLNQFAAKASQLSLIGGLAFFATAFTALLTIDRTLNRIWAVGRPRPLARRLTLYWTFLTLGPLLVGATLTINGLVVSELFGGTRLAAERLWLALLPWLASVAGLTLLYRLVPNAPVRWRDCLIGALLATLLELLKRVSACSSRAADLHRRLRCIRGLAAVPDLAVPGVADRAGRGGAHRQSALMG